MAPNRKQSRKAYDDAVESLTIQLRNAGFTGKLRLKNPIDPSVVQIAVLFGEQLASALLTNLITWAVANHWKIPARKRRPTSKRTPRKKLVKTGRAKVAKGRTVPVAF
jgi:hypothetical protein